MPRAGRRGPGLHGADLEPLIEKRSTFEYYNWDETEYPGGRSAVRRQSGSDGRAARIVVDRGAPIVDINMGSGCPRWSRRWGAALLDEPCQAAAVVEAVVKGVPVPSRSRSGTGVTADRPTAGPSPAWLKRRWAAAIAVHARTAEQGFSGLPRLGTSSARSAKPSPSRAGQR